MIPGIGVVLAFLPRLRAWLTIAAFAAGALMLFYLAYFVLDARAVAARAEADAKQSREAHIATIFAFNEYRRFTEQALGAAKRAAESRAATKRRLQPLREMTHAAPPSEDGPVPVVTERFLDGLRLELAGAGIVGADAPDPASP